MADEKDRLGDKLHQSEKALEDQWARQQDAELMEKMRKKSSVALSCPKCGKPLIEMAFGAIHTQACPDKDGAWLDQAALQQLPRK